LKDPVDAEGLDPRFQRGRRDPKLGGAPVGPDTLLRVSTRADSIVVFFLDRELFGEWAARLLRGHRLVSNQSSSTVSVSVSETMIERSITFWSSRILPGHEYDCKRSKLSG